MIASILSFVPCLEAIQHLPFSFISLLLLFAITLAQNLPVSGPRASVRASHFKKRPMALSTCSWNVADEDNEYSTVATVISNCCSIEEIWYIRSCSSEDLVPLRLSKKRKNSRER